VGVAGDFAAQGTTATATFTGGRFNLEGSSDNGVSSVNVGDCGDGCKLDDDREANQTAAPVRSKTTAIGSPIRTSPFSIYRPGQDKLGIINSRVRAEQEKNGNYRISFHKSKNLLFMSKSVAKRCKVLHRAKRRVREAGKTPIFGVDDILRPDP
jgi:hypothetical protein